MDKFPDCKALMPYLRRPGVIVERELAIIREQAEGFPYAHQELAAIRYYLHVALWECQNRWKGHHRGITNYATLLREIERWRWESKQQICFVTFNYDTMLEEALNQVAHLSFGDVEQYIASDQYKLIKPHGSVNWGREVEGVWAGSGQKTLIEAAGALKVSNRYRVVTNFPMMLYNNAVVYPALSIPVEKKDEFSCPQSHVRALEEILPKVTRVLAIGWRATEADFLALLGTRLGGQPHLMVVSGDRAGTQETAQHLDPSTARYIHASHMSEGFSGLVSNIAPLNKFLREPL